MRIPDGIEPISGYRCWSYQVSPVGVSLFPLRQFQAGPSAWAGAEARWVKARCMLMSRLLNHAQYIRELLGVASGADPALTVEDPPHEVPMEDCSCGFYAMRDLDRGLADVSLHTDLAQIYVLGRVLLAGKVIEHSRGYRAERARIAELVPVKGTERTVEPLAAALGLPMSAAV